MEDNGARVRNIDWLGWEAAGHPLPGAAAHESMMPYARTSAEEARQKGEAGKDYREAAVMIGLDAKGTIALIERTPDKGPHGGQMAMPGGAREQGETMEACAMREWREELGLPDSCVPLRPPVAMTEIHVAPSHFIVRPFLAPVALPGELAPDPIEVAEVHHIQMAHLVGGRYRMKQPVRVYMPETGAFQWTVPGFSLPGVPFVWGATALMLSEVAAWYDEWAVAP
ncbi:CoA pyrophosphatase [bacterium]|nr:CoA pyrophosphatase [bacterium]